MEKADPKLELKIRCAAEAVKFVSNKMVLGIGSGSTVREFIRLLKKSSLDLHSIICIPSSFDTEQMLIENGLLVGTLNQYSEIDLTIDGADRVDKDLNLIKGGGAALLQEKLIATAAKKVIIIVDNTKLTLELAGSFPIPIEVIPIAQNFVREMIMKLGGQPKLRLASDKLGPTITDNGNIIFDTHFTEIANLEELELKLNNIPGVVENGIFTKKLVTQVIVAVGEEIKVLMNP